MCMNFTQLRILRPFRGTWRNLHDVNTRPPHQLEQTHRPVCAFVVDFFLVQWGGLKSTHCQSLFKADTKAPSLGISGTSSKCILETHPLLRAKNSRRSVGERDGATRGSGWGWI